MVALAKQNTTTQWDYVSSALDNMYIDMDGRGPYARVPSQSGSFKHQVRFVEPKGEIPHATHCTCQSFKYRKACLHCDVTNLYFEMIYNQVPAIHEEVAPVVEVVAAETPTQRPQRAHKKPRRSAVNVALVAELQVAKKVSIATVRQACAKKGASALSSDCPLSAQQCPESVPSVPQVTTPRCKALGAKFDATQGNLHGRQGFSVLRKSA